MNDQNDDIGLIVSRLDSRNIRLFYLIIAALSVFLVAGSLLVFKGYQKIQAKIAAFTNEIDLKNREIAVLNEALRRLNNDRDDLEVSLDETKHTLLELYNSDRASISRRLNALEDFRVNEQSQIASINASLQNLQESKMNRSEGDSYYTRERTDELMRGKLDVISFREFESSQATTLSNYATTSSLSLYAKSTDLANYVKQSDFNSLRIEFQNQLNTRITSSQLETKLVSFYSKAQVDEKFVQKPNE